MKDIDKTKPVEPLSSKYITVLVFSMVLWGLSFPAIKLALEEVDPITLGLMRTLFGAVPFSIVVFKRLGTKYVLRSLKEDPYPFIAIALFQFFLPLAAQNVGMNMMAPETAASLSSIIQATAPIFGLFLSALILKEYIGLKKALGAAIALSGTILLVTRGGVVLSGTDFTGNILLLASAVFYAISGVITKQALNKHEPEKVITLALILSSMFFLPTALLTENIHNLTSVSIFSWTLMAYLGIICTGIALFLWYVVLRKNQLSKQILFTYLIPLFGTGFSHIFLGESMGLKTALFGIIIIIGISIAQYEKKREAKDK